MKDKPENTNILLINPWITDFKAYDFWLKPHGLLYISVPIWFAKMGNFGLDGWDLEYYYDPSHINVWTEKLFVTLLNKCGLEIIKTDHWMYDSTYLCKRNDELMSLKPEFEQALNIKQIMQAIKEASLAYDQHDFETAINKFPNFPVAWVNYYEKSRAQAHQGGQGKDPLEHVKDKFIGPALKSCPYSLEILRMVADIHMRYEDFEGAVKVCQRALDARPNHASFLMTLAHCFREIGLRAKDPADKVRMLTESRDCANYLKDVDLSMRNEAVSWVYRDNSEIPTPHEL